MTDYCAVTTNNKPCLVIIDLDYAVSMCTSSRQPQRQRCRHVSHAAAGGCSPVGVVGSQLA